MVTLREFTTIKQAIVFVFVCNQRSQEASRDLILASHLGNSVRVQSVATTSNHASILDLVLSQKLWMCIFTSHLQDSDNIVIFVSCISWMEEKKNLGR